MVKHKQGLNLCLLAQNGVLDYLIFMPPARSATSRHTRVALAQLKVDAHPEQNLKNAAIWVEKAASRGAQLICLPELFRTPYFCQKEEAKRFDLSESIPGPTTQLFAKLAKKHKVTILVPVFERRAAGLYHNSAVLLGEKGELAGQYRKMHIPDDPGFYEKYYFTPGDLGFQSFSTPSANVGVLICWDQWYPEAARLTALLGAEILFYPTAIGWHPKEKKEFGAAQLDAWKTAQRAHAIANGVFVAACNRVGLEKDPSGGDGLEFWGHSFVCDPFGRMLAEAGEDEELLVCDLELNRIEEVRRNWPFLRDRRIDAFGGLLHRYGDEAV